MNPTATITHDHHPTPTVTTLKPVTVPAAGRGTVLHVRISAPSHGDRLPIVVFSHGFGQSFDGYGPLVDALARDGLVVIQPSHLDSRSLQLPDDDPRTPNIWRTRVDDLHRIVDHLGTLGATMPELFERLDIDNVAVAGHSWGAQSASMLLGARVLDEHGEPGPDRRHHAVTAGVLLSVPGSGAQLTEFARTNFGFMNPDFSAMTTPTLVVAGDHDHSPLTERGPDWFTDAHHHSPANTTLVTIRGGEHSLGGIGGDGLAETTDPDPARVALVQRLTTAFLHASIGHDDTEWTAARHELAAGREVHASLEV